MGERIRNHIRSNVVGYIALFVALSGTAGAIIIIGGAPAGFDATKGVGATSERVLRVPGVGVVSARCDVAGLDINWKNTTPGAQKLFVDDGGMDPSVHSLRSAAAVGFIVDGVRPEHVQLLAFKPGDAGTPMAEVGIWVQFGGDCVNAQVAVQSLSSEVLR
nr:hypothetical protein [Actinomycetota bacterium]